MIGHFGSIYPGKQPNALPEIGATLKARGLEAAHRLYRILHPRRRQCRAGFEARAAELGIAEEVIVSGFVDDERGVLACSTRSMRSVTRSTKASPRGAPAS